MQKYIIIIFVVVFKVIFLYCQETDSIYPLHLILARNEKSYDQRDPYYQLKPDDSIQVAFDLYFETYQEFLYSPETQKQRYQNDLKAQRKIIGQTQIFSLLEQFEEQLKKNPKYKNIKIQFQVEILTWDRLLGRLEEDVDHPQASIVHFGSSWTGWLAHHDYLLPLNPYITLSEMKEIYFTQCIKCSQLTEDSTIWSLPYVGNMKIFLVRKDMIDSCDHIDPDSMFSNWDSFIKYGTLFNQQISALKKKGFKDLKRFWLINGDATDWTILQNLYSIIKSNNTDIIQSNQLWKNLSLTDPKTLESIRQYFSALKQIGDIYSSETTETGEIFHQGHYCVIFCTNSLYRLFQKKNPHLKDQLKIFLPPGKQNKQITYFGSSNLGIVKKKNKNNYDIEFQLINFLSTDSVVQFDYLAEESHIPVIKKLKKIKDFHFFYEVLSDSNKTVSFPNFKEFKEIESYLSQEQRISSIYNILKNSSEFDEKTWLAIKDFLKISEERINKLIIPSLYYYMFYQKTISISILSLILISVIFYYYYTKKNTALKKILIEQKKMEKSFKEKTWLIQSEKEKLAKEKDKYKSELSMNIASIEELKSKLNSKEEYRNQNTELQNQIDQLKKTNKNLSKQLENTVLQIHESNKKIDFLTQEMQEHSKLEVYIDFQKKQIRMGENFIFKLSPTAKKYKLKFFKLLEFLIRQQADMIHLLPICTLYKDDFIQSLKNQNIRNFYSQGKFGIIRSGLNKTFQMNIQVPFLLNDKVPVYVFSSDSGDIYEIKTPNHELHLQLNEITDQTNYQLTTFPNANFFHYYVLNKQIHIKCIVSISRYK